MLRSLILTFAMLLTAAAPARQFGGRTLDGYVTDLRGNALPGCVVQLENTTNLNVRSYITDSKGHYYFNELNQDVDYVVRAHYRRYWSRRKTVSKFNSAVHPKVDLVIPID